MMLRVDCHCHFGGCVTPAFVWNAIRAGGSRHLAETYDDVVAAMTFAPDESWGFHRFLNKFKILDELNWTEDLLDASIKQVCQDLIADHIDYRWLRFSINKYLPHLKWHRHELISYVRAAFDRYAPGRVGLVLSLKYESARAGQRQLAQLINHPDVAAAVVGIDLVGDENFFDAKFYGPLLKPWGAAGKVVFAHVGESQPLRNVVRAVADCGVTDICHGLAVADIPLVEMDEYNRGVYSDLLAKLRDKGVCFHMAITSTYMTGVWQRPDYYPIVDILRSGNQVTIGTDDPVQCGLPHQRLSLDAEYGRLATFLTPPEVDLVKAHAVIRTDPFRSAINAG